MTAFLGFRTEDDQRVVDWFAKTPLPYEQTHELIKILLNGQPYNPDVLFTPRQPGHDPEGMT